MGTYVLKPGKNCWEEGGREGVSACWQRVIPYLNSHFQREKYGRLVISWLVTVVTVVVVSV